MSYYKPREVIQFLEAIAPQLLGNAIESAPHFENWDEAFSRVKFCWTKYFNPEKQEDSKFLLGALVLAIADAEACLLQEEKQVLFRQNVLNISIEKITKDISSFPSVTGYTLPTVYQKALPENELLSRCAKNQSHTNVTNISFWQKPCEFMRRLKISRETNNFNNIWDNDKYKTDEERVIALMKDYTRHNWAARAVAGHWDRNHVSALTKICKQAKGKSAQKLVEELLDISLYNQNGTLSHLIHFLQNDVYFESGNQPIKPSPPSVERK